MCLKSVEHSKKHFLHRKKEKCEFANSIFMTNKDLPIVMDNGQGCQSHSRSRPFWLEPEPIFGPAPAPTPTPTLTQRTVNILFLGTLSMTMTM